MYRYTHVNHELQRSLNKRRNSKPTGPSNNRRHRAKSLLHKLENVQFLFVTDDAPLAVLTVEFLNFGQQDIGAQFICLVERTLLLERESIDVAFGRSVESLRCWPARVLQTSST